MNLSERRDDFQKNIGFTSSFLTDNTERIVKKRISKKS
jgi:hypothetical protein